MFIIYFKIKKKIRNKINKLKKMKKIHKDILNNLTRQKYSNTNRIITTIKSGIDSVQDPER